MDLRSSKRQKTEAKDVSAEPPQDANRPTIEFTTSMVAHQVAGAIGYRDQWLVPLYLAWALRKSDISFVFEVFGIDVLFLRDKKLVGAVDSKTASKKHGETTLPRTRITSGLESSNVQLDRIQEEFNMQFNESNPLRFLYSTFQPVEGQFEETEASKELLLTGDLVPLRVFDLFWIQDTEAAGVEDFERSCGAILVLRINDDKILGEMTRHFRIRDRDTMRGALVLASDELQTLWRHTTATPDQHLPVLSAANLFKMIEEKLHKFSLEAMDLDSDAFAALGGKEIVDALQQQSKDDTASFQEIAKSAIDIEEIQQNAEQALQNADHAQQQAAEAQQHAAEAQQHAAEAQQHAAETQQHAAETQQHADETQQHADEAQQHADETQQRVAEQMVKFQEKLDEVKKRLRM